MTAIRMWARPGFDFVIAFAILVMGLLIGSLISSQADNIEFDLPGLADSISSRVSIESSKIQEIADFGYWPDELSDLSESEFISYIEERYSTWGSGGLAIAGILFGDPTSAPGISLRVGDRSAEVIESQSAEQIAELAFMLLRDTCSFFGQPEECKAAIYRTAGCDEGQISDLPEPKLDAGCGEGAVSVVHYATAVYHQGRETALTSKADSLFLLKD